ncbi:MAG: hypothetical protein V3V14_12535 [Saprospiraceae bacterium]
MKTFCVFDNVKRIVAKRTVKESWEKHPETKEYLQIWYETVRSAKWVKPNRR